MVLLLFLCSLYLFVRLFYSVLFIHSFSFFCFGFVVDENESLLLYRSMLIAVRVSTEQTADTFCM